MSDITEKNSYVLFIDEYAQIALYYYNQLLS